MRKRGGKKSRKRQDNSSGRSAQLDSLRMEAAPVRTLPLLMPPQPAESVWRPALDQLTRTVTVTVDPTEAVVMSVGEVVRV